MRVIGVNLSASSEEGTGVAEYEDGKIRTFTVYKDKEIVEVVDRFKPEIVAINAPLFNKDSKRSAEKELEAIGYTIDVSRSDSANRGAHIKYKLEGKSKLIECDSELTKKSLAISDYSQLNNVRPMNIVKNEREKNAIISAATAVFFKEDLYEQFGDDEEGYVILPKLK